MNSIKKNKGIIMSNSSSIKSENILIGKNSKIEQNNINKQEQIIEIEKRLQELVTAINKNGNKLDDPNDLIQSTKIVSQELKKEKPSKTTIMGILENIVKIVSPIKDIATTASTVHSLIKAYIN